MSRPVNKSELLSQSRNNFDRLNNYINSLSDEVQQQEFIPGTLNRNIRDVLAHLHHWHLLMRNWYETGMAGKKPDIPAKGYTWKTTSQLNQKIKENYEINENIITYDTTATALWLLGAENTEIDGKPIKDILEISK